MLVLRLGLRLELAPEYDSNANRVESIADSAAPQPIASFLLRSAVRGRLAYTADGYSLRLALDGGTKFFFAPDARPQDTAVVRLQAEGGRRFGARGSLSLAGEYLDSFQWNPCPSTVLNGKTIADTSCHRDLRLAAVRLGGSVADGIPSLAAEGGLRRYEWKPDPDLSFLGLSATVGPSARLSSTSKDDERHDWVLALQGRVEWRRFDGGALLTRGDIGGLDPKRPRRSDLVGTLALSLAYTGRVMASAAWLLESDRSNSAEGAYLFQMLTMRLAVPLPARMTAAARAQLLFFSSGHLPSALTADEENRDSLLFDLSRDMGRGFTVGARYLVFRSATGDASHDYFRQVVSLSLVWAGDK